MKFDYEFVEFYPKKTRNKKFIGTAHIYHIPTGMDLRGLPVWRNSKHSLYVKSPFFQNYDPDQKKMVSYPMIGFTDPEKNSEFRNFLDKVVKVEIAKRLGIDLKPAVEKTEVGECDGSS